MLEERLSGLHGRELRLRQYSSGGYTAELDGKPLGTCYARDVVDRGWDLPEVTINGERVTFSVLLMEQARWPRSSDCWITTIIETDERGNVISTDVEDL